MTRDIPANGGRPVAPGGTIGILGGGQLGRMTIIAAAELGYRSHVFCPQPESPAAQVATANTVADYDDRAALTRFAESVDVVTFEFENIPYESVKLLAEHVPVRPGWRALQVAQDRVAEKDFLRDIGIATAPYHEVAGPETLNEAIAAIGRPAILKSARFGYDGKGQVRIDAGTDPADAWSDMGGDRAILEGFVDFECEISVIAARGLDGSTIAYVPVENRHLHHILHQTIVPASIPPALAAEARSIAPRIIDALGIFGLVAVEMFVTRDGRVLVNELAPRPHNSGHWTIDACLISQFEQFVRAVCGLPLGSPRRHSDAVMTNLLGYDIDGWQAFLSEPDTRLHIYGKTEARPGRKMGHVTRLKRRQD